MRTVMIIGMSLMLSSIAEALRHRSGLRVVQVEDRGLDSEPVPGIRPDVVVLDMSEAPLDVVSDLLSNYPGLLLLGAGAKNNELLVLSGRPAGVLTTEQLVQLIGAGGLAAKLGG